MTLTDYEKNNACCSGLQAIPEQTSSDVGAALREAVWQAQEQGRLRCGVVDCAHLLEIDPFNVLMCVMPATEPEDVSALIQRTLIKAFCHEYQILLIKVDSVNKLDKLLQGRPNPQTDQTTEVTFTSTSTTTTAIATLPPMPSPQTFQPSSASSSYTAITTSSSTCFSSSRSSSPGTCLLNAETTTTISSGSSPAAVLQLGPVRGLACSSSSSSSIASTTSSTTTACLATAKVAQAMSMAADVADTSCVLLKYADGGVPSAAEDVVAKHCKAVAGCDGSFDPTIFLPD